MALHYVEIVTPEVDTLVALYEKTLGVTFGPPDADLGQARVAEQSDRSVIGIRKPLASHETPIVRTYVAVDDIAAAVKKAEAAGAVIAYGPQAQGARGTFAILFSGGIQVGLWQV